MKTTFYLMLIGMLLLGNCSSLPPQKPGAAATTQFRQRSAQGLIRYFDQLIRDSLIVVGQHCAGEDNNQTKGYQTFFENLHTETGKYPGLLGFEYGYRANVNHAEINAMLIDHWKKGGIVTLTWCADNPFKDGYNVNWNAIQHRDSIDLKKLLATAPESVAKSNYRNELMKVATALKALKKAGVVVLWRPFHEMNGSWFWWGPNDAKSPSNLEDFKLLWQDQHQTFAQMGLDNLVWVYAVNNPFNAVSRDAISGMYPGAAYVDIVGMDIYKAPVPDFVDNYELLKPFNKTIVVAECGDDIDNQGKKVLDELDLLKKYRGKAGYFMQWHSWHNPRLNVKVRRAIIDNPNAKAMMNHSTAITLDELR